MSARTRHRHSAHAAKRRDAPQGRWTKPAEPLDYGRERFRFTLHRGARRLPAVNLDPYVEHASWQRDGTQRTGEITFRRPLTDTQAREVAHGDTVLCELAAWGPGRWRPLWQLMVDSPNETVAGGVISVALVSQLDAAQKSRASFKFRKDKAHPHGWTATEITVAVARRFRIRLGRVAQSTHRIDRLVTHSMSPVDVITAAWRRERTHTGRRFDVDVSRGLMEVRELRWPWYMLLIGRAISDATIDDRIDGVASALIVTATKKRAGKRARAKLRVKVTNPGRIRRFGYIVRQEQAPHNVDTLPELRAYAQKRLARLHAPRPQVTFTHPGLPWLDRGDAIRLALPEVGLEQIVYVTAVRHDVSAGSYIMDVTVSWTDPWAADARKARTASRRAAAATRRHRPGTTVKVPLKPAKARVRTHP